MKNEELCLISAQELMELYTNQSFSPISEVYTEHDDIHQDIPDYDDVSW